MSEQLRLFIALQLPAHLCRLLNQNARALVAPQHRLAWVRPEAMHLTLRFLGDTPVEQLPALQAVLARVASGHLCCELRVGKPGVFKQSGIPRVLWWGLEGDVIQLEQMATALEKALIQLDYPPAGKPFQAHITLARVKQGTPELADPFLQEIHPDQELIQVTAIQLVQSTLHPQGGRYRTLSTCPLKTSTC